MTARKLVGLSFTSTPVQRKAPFSFSLNSKIQIFYLGIFGLERSLPVVNVKNLMQGCRAWVGAGVE